MVGGVSNSAFSVRQDLDSYYYYYYKYLFIPKMQNLKAVTIKIQTLTSSF